MMTGNNHFIYISVKISLNLHDFNDIVLVVVWTLICCVEKEILSAFFLDALDPGPKSSDLFSLHHEHYAHRAAYFILPHPLQLP